MRFPLTLLVALAGLAATADAQPALDARLAGALDLIRSGEAAAQDRGAFDLRLVPELELGGRHARVSYALDAGTFATPGDWSFLAQELRGVYRVDMHHEQARLFLGGLGSRRANGDDWALADYSGLGAFANLELKPAANATMRLGYRFDQRWFRDLSELDQTEHGAFVSTNLVLKSRTTLIGELRLGGKSYAGQDAPFFESEVPAVGERSRGMGPGLRQTPLALASRDGERARLVSVMGRVAQSLGDRTGAWLQYAQRWSSGDVPPALVTTPALFYDDGVYDDPFASDATALAGGLKHVFASGAVAQAFGSWQSKDYRGAPALGLDGLPLPGDELRRDRVTHAGAGFELPLLAGRTGRGELGLELRYGFTRHRSNDAFYDYSSQSFGLAAGIRF